jgi:histidinol-phosphate phosphatase family protein
MYARILLNPVNHVQEFPSARPAVFLDRDGIINRPPGPGRFVLEWPAFQFLPDVPASLLRLRHAGFFLALITNQSCVGRGLMTEATLQEIHVRMQAALGAARLDAIYYCPHRPDAGCPCRKPAPELIRRAAQAHGLDLPHSFMVGDARRDILMGRAAGCRTILCRPDRPTASAAPEDRPDHWCRTLPEAVDWVLAQTS